MKTIDLNCDMGESYGAWKMGADAEVMPHISSANIACGFHGGDPATIRKTVRLALDHGVAIGAHPSLPDLQGFGRRPMKISPQDMYDLVVYQAGAVEAFARAGVRVTFHEFTHPEYPQCGKAPFARGLSAIDMLFNCGPQSREWLFHERTPRKRAA
jgi:lactam utilization protein B